jgi:hypothetical protein
MDWICSHQLDDGSFGPVETMSHYMLAGASLLYGRRPEAAARLMPALRRLFVKPEGGFNAPEILAGRASALQERGYGPSWMIYSSHLNFAYDISLRAMPTLLRLQDPKSGGMFGRLEDAEAGKGIINTAVTCVACGAAVLTGHTAEARRMGDHLIDNVLQSNPDLGNAFYPIWDTERGLRTDDEAPASPNMPRVLRRFEPAQHHFLSGMLMGAMVDLYRLFRERRYLDAALQVYEFAAGGTPAIYESTASHKFAWGCAWLYQETGDAAHLESACRLSDYLCGIQEADGSFVHWAFVKSAAEWPYSPRLNITAQFSLWIARTLQALEL